MTDAQIAASYSTATLKGIAKSRLLRPWPERLQAIQLEILLREIREKNQDTESTK